MSRLKKGLALVLTLCLMLSLVPFAALAAPSGTTNNQPFSSGTGGSTNFRIPALVTLSDGTLVAACDARWNHSSDGFGLDTIVSCSSDQGANWSYTFANYLGDNGDAYNADSTAFIDPALVVTSDDTIFMLVDLYPHGTYISNVKAGTGFDDNGHLLLRDNNGSSYDYYVGDFADGTANIYQTNGTQVSGYTVDEYYNITGNGVATNLFFSDSPYQVLGTSYLYLTKSTDGGETWSTPMMLNSQVKNSGDMFYGVGPGRGLVTSTGRIMFPCYTYTTRDGNTSVIYSDDKGETWHRSEETSVQTSEAALVEADGRVYMFTRHGGYFVSENDGESWSAQKNVGISYTTSCQLSAITYSQKIDGKTAILLSAPTSSRNNGKIFVGLVQDDGSINWKYTYNVNSSAYAYSCLTELKDGSIGLLYESAGAAITYTNLAISNIASGATIGAPKTVTDSASGVSVTAPGLETVEVTKKTDSTPYSGYTKSVTYSMTLNNGSYTDSAEVKIPYDSSVFDGCTQFIGSVDGDTFPVKKVNDYFVGTVLHFSDVTISGRAADTTATKPKDISLYVGQSQTVTDETGNYKSSYTGEGLNTDIATVIVEGDDGQEAGVEYKTANVTCNDLISSDSNNNWVAASGYYYTPDGTNYYPVYAKRNSATKGSWWQYTEYTYTWGYKVGNLDPTQIGKAQVEGSRTSDGRNATPDITVYRQEPVAGTPASTTITFTGKAVGDTFVIVGTTKYIIHVKEQGGENDVTVAVGQTIDVKAGALKEGETVKWSVSDSTYAGMYSDGANATIIGRAKGTTTVTATIYDANDKVVGTYIWNVTVTAGSQPNAGSYTVTFSYDCTIYNGTLYYSIDGGPLKEAVVDTTANDAGSSEVGTTYTVQETDKNVAYASIVWFVKPNEGYAVTTVGADENSKSQFYALDKEKKSFTYGKNHSGGKIENFLTEAEEKAMLEEAISLGCDAVFWNSRGSESGHLNGNASANGTYVIHCDKLPTITKRVAYLKHHDVYTAYTEGMNAVVGDSIIFEIVVTTYNESGTGITYSDAYMKDVMTGISGTAQLYNVNSIELTPIDNYNITGTLNSDGTTGNTHTYYVQYVIQDADLDQQLTNDVTLTYEYQSTYSSGAYGGEANASAKIMAVSFDPKDIVVDFGLPVTIDYSGEKDHGRYNLVSGTATYGDVIVNNNKVTYTPNAVLRGIDTVTLTNTVGGTYTFKVYPATTVYYEEGFATGFTGGSKGTGTQTAQIAGSSSDEYGYDTKYAAENNGPSNNTQAISTAAGDKATFNFTGTGVDIYANCAPNTGAVMIKVKQGENTVKAAQVLTALKKGTTDATLNQDKTGYNVPIVSFTDLNYGSYTVEITHIKTKNDTGDTIAEVKLDGFRVYGTMNNDALHQEGGVYYLDKEDNPTFIEMRDQVLAGLSRTSTGSGQVNAALPKDTTVAVVASSEKYTQVNVDDLLKNGPKNEIYLQPNQALVLKITTDREVQIGLKALNAATTYTITGKDSNQAISTSTDMFYTVLQKATNTNRDQKIITITNTGTGILAVTKLKVCDDPNATLGTLTEEDLTDALVSLGIVNTAEEPGGSGGSSGGGGNTPAEPTEPTTPPTGTGLPFTDVTTGDWFLDSVKYVYEKGLMNGTSETTFSPKQTTNRAMIVTILHRLENSPAVDAQSPFADVAADQYYANPVAWAAANGIVTGTSETTFAPLNNITREQMAAILYRYAQFKGYDVSVGEDTNILSYTDAETISEYAVPAIQWAVGSGLINGKGGGVLDPQGSATRAEVSAILARFCEAYAK